MDIYENESDWIHKIRTTSIVNGKLVEYWNVTDSLDFFKQLGVIEYTEKGKKLFPEDAK